jgi:transcriptional regulator with XRE-family HTH domain
MEDVGLKHLFGKRVQHLRRLRKLTQEQLADDTDLSVDTISNIERGLSSTRIETVGSLAKALNVTLAELFEFPMSGHTHKAGWKETQKLLDIISRCPADRLPALTKMIEQAVDLTKP